MNRLLLSVFWTLLTLASLPSLFAQDSNWPRTVPLGQGMVTIYSPQIDGKNGNTIQYRAALAYRATAGSEPIFGAGWFESTVSIDSTNRIVHPTDLSLTETRFPAGTADIQSELASVVMQQSPGWNLDFSVDELDNALKAEESEIRAINTTPPKIVYRDHPALLISIDGEPVLREIENSPYKAVINTPYPLISDGKYYYLNAAKDVWYRARTVTGPYQFETTPPAAIAAMVSPDDEATAEEQTDEPITAANAPEIVVTTEPAELIVTEGPAAFVPLVDDLLVLQNSNDDVFMHVSSQYFYIVLAGRWYRAYSLTGPWSYQLADDLPKAFANIPRDSNQADSRVYVAGTEEAKDAVLDAQVPQTAAVKRGEVDIEVEYDGEPVYQPVDGTELVYVQNTGSTVLVSGGLYYLVEEGVWYVSSNPNGPWQVSDHRPEQVDTILPTSPVYNTRYVHVYDSTPSVVYVGYTPGYTGSYVYRNTIFYGTGWNYRPWVSPYYYYPRFSTWGFNVSYNSWSGWDFGLSWGWGPFNVSYYSGGYWHRNHSWYHPRYGRWGPGRYRHRPSHHRRGHDRYAYNGSRRGGRDSGRGGSRDRYDGRYDDQRYDNSRDRGGNSRPRDSGQNHNLYRDESQRARVTNTRDKQPRPSNRYSADSRRVNSKSNDGRRVQSYAGKSKAERNRLGPVSSSELRSKASVRDVNRKANRSRLLADNSGNIYSKADRKTNRSSRLGGVGGSERPTSLASVQPNKTRASANRGTRQTSLTGRSSARQSQQKAIEKRQRAPLAGKTSGRKSQAKTPGYDARQRSSTSKKATKRSSQSKRSVNNTRQRTVVAANKQAKQPRQVTSKNRSGQKAVRKASAPVRQQNNSSPAPKAKSSRSGAQKSSPVQKASRNSTRKSSYQRSGSKSGNGGGKRSSGRRSGNK
ncbi:MAG: hypothetical protein QNK19_09555 [Xanthomonadales bacterium]|nr:hypothetical protein [Xanthomonadales bacterium]